MTSSGESMRPPHQRLLAREFFASALYMALVILAGLVALPVAALPGDSALVAAMFGTALGLVVAHWLAFRLAAHMIEELGVWSASASQEAGAQVAGGLVVAGLASLPFIVWDGDEALRISLLVLAALPALTGLAIARLRGLGWPRSVAAAAIEFGVAFVIVQLKAAVGH